MFRLNTGDGARIIGTWQVSILQMFRLNENKWRKNFYMERVSILQMFRLNNYLFIEGKTCKEGFNTSDVSVECKMRVLEILIQKMFQYFRCFGWIDENEWKPFHILVFQYFRCFGWILPHPRRFRRCEIVSILQMFRLNFRSNDI